MSGMPTRSRVGLAVGDLLQPGGGLHIICATTSSLSQVRWRTIPGKGSRICGCRLRSACGSSQLAASLFSPAEPGPREGLRAAVRFGFNPKKSGPDHAVPVIFRAMAESER